MRYTVEADTTMQADVCRKRRPRVLVFLVVVWRALLACLRICRSSRVKAGQAGIRKRWGDQDELDAGTRGRLRILTGRREWVMDGRIVADHAPGGGTWRHACTHFQPV